MKKELTKANVEIVMIENVIYYMNEKRQPYSRKNLRI